MCRNIPEDTILQVKQEITTKSRPAELLTTCLLMPDDGSDMFL
jgi:hypothetical protein